MNKIKQFFLKRKISKMMRDFLWEQNSPETREKIRDRLFIIFKKFDYLVDKTTPELVDEGFILYSGIIRKGRKMTRINTKIKFLNSEITNENISIRI